VLREEERKRRGRILTLILFPSEGIEGKGEKGGERRNENGKIACKKEKRGGGRAELKKCIRSEPLPEYTRFAQGGEKEKGG